jgi:riboflavin kinase/FMN adenylyltransferase
MALVHGSLDPSSDPAGYALIDRRGPSVVTLGKFDGIHRGHRALLSRTLLEARRRGCQAGLVTFDRHPREALLGLAHRSLTSMDQRRSLLSDAGMNFMLLLRATKELFATEPESFVRGLVAALKCRAIVVGESFRFGHRAQGDVALLAGVANTLGVEVIAVALEERMDGVVSSTRIRAELEAGRVERVGDLLGRPFAVRGTVRRTEQRTFCIDISSEVAVPACGSYVGRVVWNASSTLGQHAIVEMAQAMGNQPAIRILSTAALSLATGMPATIVFERRTRHRLAATN